MTNIFYTFGVLLIILDILRVFGVSPFKKLIEKADSFKEDTKHMSDNEKKEKGKELLKVFIKPLLFFISVVLWGFLGLFSSNHWWFVLLLGTWYTSSKFSKNKLAVKGLTIIAFVIQCVIANNHYNFLSYFIN